MPNLLTGEKIRLAALAPGDAAHLARWSQHDLYLRLLDTDAARPSPVSAYKEDLEKGEVPEHTYDFAIRALDGDRCLGFIGMRLMPPASRDAWMGMGIGEPADWGQGYGTEALRLLLRFGFTVLGLHRITLGVFAYNPRAQRAYEKAGFTVEGRTREDVRRDGVREDSLWMGILRSEWEEQNPKSQIPNL